RPSERGREVVQPRNALRALPRGRTLRRWSGSRGPKQRPAGKDRFTRGSASAASLRGGRRGPTRCRSVLPYRSCFGRRWHEMKTFCASLLSFLPLGVPGAACLPLQAAETAAATTPTVRVAGIVLKWVRADKEANYRRVEPLIREAARKGAKIVCTTECFLDGYAIADNDIPLEQYLTLAQPIPPGPYYRPLATLAPALQ